MNLLLKSLLVSVCLFAWIVSLQAQDWPRFRGVNGDGASPETNLLSEWPEEGPRLVWTADDLGKGFSSVAVVGNRVYTIGDVDDQQFVFAVSNETGKEIWRTAIDEGNPGDFTGSRSTPTFNDGMLYCLTTDCKLVCLNADDGEVAWENDLVESVGATIMLAKGKWQWKFSESPLVEGDLVIVTPGASDAAMLALDKKSGEEVWRCQIPDLGRKGMDGAGYSSAVIGNACGVKQVVQLTGRGVIGVEYATGKYLWGYNRVANDVANISSPVVSGDHVFVSTGYQTGSALLRLTKNDAGEFSVEEEYFLRPTTFQNHHGGFVLHDGHIYGGQGHKMGLPICIRMEDGEVIWGPIRNEGKASAACCLADGHLYMRYQNGLVVLIEATPQEYREKGSFMIPRVRAESWSHPVISGGKLYLKEQEQLYCYDISE